MRLTPKEKAKNLYDRFSVNEFNPSRGWDVTEEETKDLCKGIVDEILASGHGWNKETSTFVKYWEEVKEEIDKLNQQ